MKEDSYLDIREAEKFLPHAQLTEPLVGEIESHLLLESLDTRIFTMGSCFAQNLQKALQKYKFDVYFERNICAHYSARSVKETLSWIANEDKHDQSELFYHAGDDVCSYRHFRVRRYGEDAEQQVLNDMHQLDIAFRDELKKSKVVIITLGTSLTWRHNETGHCICYFGGIPVDIFEKVELSTEDIKQDLAQIHHYIQKIRGNNDFELMFTVSPQRYPFAKKYTELPFLQYNSFSKAKNIIAIHEFIANSEFDNITYFPSYEMVIDELRPFETMCNYDYLHIRQQHTPDYVVKRFLQSYSAPSVLRSLELIDEFSQLTVFTQSRQNNGASIDSVHIKSFWDKLLNKINEVVPNEDDKLKRIVQQYLSSIDREFWMDEC